MVLCFLNVMKSDDVGMSIGLKDGDFHVEIVENFFGEFLGAPGDGFDGDYFGGAAVVLGVVARVAFFRSDSFVDVGEGTGS